MLTVISVDQGCTRQVDHGVIMAGALVCSAPIVILFIVLQRFFIAGLTMGAVKG